MSSLRLLLMIAITTAFASVAAADPTTEKGTVTFKPVADQADIPERYRLAERQFDYELSYKMEFKSSGAKVYRIHFPSAVDSPDAENNIVHGEYYRPDGKGPFPGIVVLDVIRGSDQIVSRSLSAQLSAKA